MTDLSTTIAPKSDQLNADDLISGPRTITITKVSANPDSAEQPISIFFDGDAGKPYKPCKSMRRVLVRVWGTDGTKFVGRAMTLYRDDKVQFGGLAVGGIRISQMSHIETDVTMALTATRASRKPFTVRPLVVKQPEPEPVAPKKRSISDWLDALEHDLTAAQDSDAVDAIMEREDVKRAATALKNGALERFNAMITAALGRTAPAE